MELIQSSIEFLSCAYLTVKVDTDRQFFIKLEVIIQILLVLLLTMIQDKACSVKLLRRKCQCLPFFITIVWFQFAAKTS